MLEAFGAHLVYSEGEKTEINYVKTSMRIQEGHRIIRVIKLFNCL